MSEPPALDTHGVSAQFSEHGCLVLGGIFSPSFIGALHDGYLERYGAMTAEEMEARCKQPGATEFFEVGERRYEIAPVMKPPFADPRLFANDALRSVLDLLLGEGYKASSFTIVVSYPGAEMQHFHRDHSHLFAGENVGRDLPSHAINVAVPLVDLDAEVGSTGLWPGSHRWETDAPCNEEQMVAPTVRRGDCMMIDYRTMHAGMPNRSTRVRPILYLVYARPWFFDERNFVSRNPLDLPEAEYAKLEPAVQELMSRSARMRLLAKR